MLRTSRFRTASLVLAHASLVAFHARPARAGDLDLEDAPASPTKNEPIVPAAPIATIKPHAYTLGECLSLAERNHPLVWASRARLAAVHAQLDEAKTLPYSYWSANSRFGILPKLGGTPFFNAVPREILNQDFSDSQPFFQFSLTGTLPIYTFGKIESGRRAVEASVRVNEWDVEKFRQQIRMDVRRAYYGLMASRDALYLADDVLGKLNNAIDNVAKKLADNDTTVEEADRLRLEIYRDELLVRVADARKNETSTTAALRFLTGVQTAFDILDAPLRRSEVMLGPVVRYLSAARIFRPDINMARSGVAARRAQVDFARAQLFPNFGVGTGFSYSIAPGSVPQRAYFGDASNVFGAAIAFGMEWGLDLLPKSARIQFAESQLEEARAMERYALGGVAFEVESAYASAVEAKTREENWDRAEHRAKRWISAVQDAIDIGTKEDRYLIEPLRSYIFARANHVQALMDFNVALGELARVTGWDAAGPPS